MGRKATAFVLGVVTLGLATGFAPFAQASNGDWTTTGYCTLKAFQPATTTMFTGTISAATATTDPSGNPTGATTECYIWVNAVAATPAYSFRGSNGVQAGTAVTQFEATATDNIALCKDVYFDSAFRDLTCTNLPITVVPAGLVVVGKD